MAVDGRRSVGGCFPLRFATSNRLLQRHVYTFSEGEILRVRGTPRFEQDIMGPRVSRRRFCRLRLTPEKYHYNHTPVAGVICDFYENDGDYHSCNPGPVVSLATPYSKNKRVVTVIDTNVAGGTGVGWVAMIEVVALMVGDIAQCYSETEYKDPQPAGIGMFLQRGCPKSLFRPGSSTPVLLFQNDGVEFAQYLIRNCC